jgi:hypothetical protein
MVKKKSIFEEDEIEDDLMQTKHQDEQADGGFTINKDFADRYEHN